MSGPFDRLAFGEQKADFLKKIISDSSQGLAAGAGSPARRPALRAQRLLGMIRRGGRRQRAIDEQAVAGRGRFARFRTRRENVGGRFPGESG